MSKICALCNNTKRGKEYLLCFGSCNRAYHVDCLDWKFHTNDNWIKAFNDCPFAVFMCGQCQSISNEQRILALNAVASKIDEMDNKITVLSANFPAASVVINKAAETLANSCTASLSTVVNSIGDQIADQIRDCFAQISIATNRPSTHHAAEYSSSSTNPIITPAASISHPSYSVICGTKSCNLPDTIVVKKQKFWFHLSQFDPAVNETAIADFVNDTLIISNAEATKLIPSGCNLADMKYVCFKVGVDADLKDTVMSTESWPNDICVRPFNNLNFRQRHSRQTRSTRRGMSESNKLTNK